MTGLFVTATSILLAGGLVQPAADLRARVESAPKDVERFIVRRVGCNHFLGEEPYDQERAAELDRAIRDLRCAKLESNERTLRRVYRNQPAVLNLLDETADLLGW